MRRKRGGRCGAGLLIAHGAALHRRDDSRAGGRVVITRLTGDSTAGAIVAHRSGSGGGRRRWKRRSERVCIIHRGPNGEPSEVEAEVALWVARERGGRDNGVPCESHVLVRSERVLARRGGCCGERAEQGIRM